MKTPISAVAQTYTGPEPTNFSDLLRLVAANTTYSWDDTGSAAVVVSSAAPADLTAIWFVVTPFSLPLPGAAPTATSGGKPLGMKRYYAGAWRYVYPGPNDHDLVYFCGVWANFFNAFGLGLAGTSWEGYALCLGNYGTPNLGSQFIVAGYRNDAANAWVTKISTGIPGGGDAYKGGADTKVLGTTNLPTIVWPVKVQQGFLGVGSGASGVPLGSTDTWAGSGGLQAGNVVGGYLGAQQPITTLPPYVALAVCQWVGY